jgi:hypothetical protein
MQTDAQGNIPTPSVPHHKRYGLRGVFTILLMLLLLIGVVALLLSHQANSATRNLPTTIHWRQVLQQYFVESLDAAPFFVLFLPTVLAF